MKILLTNDDGYDHPGINTLFQELSKHYEVFMMAPDTNKSGFSSALTFLTPITEQKIEENELILRVYSLLLTIDKI